DLLERCEATSGPVITDAIKHALFVFPSAWLEVLRAQRSAIKLDQRSKRHFACVGVQPLLFLAKVRQPPLRQRAISRPQTARELFASQLSLKVIRVIVRPIKALTDAHVTLNSFTLLCISHDL